ncbi:MAG: ABC transporter ATP-binding protein [Spirochaetota bacterium]
MKELKTLLPYFKKYLFWYIPGIICLVVTDGGQLVVPQIVRKAVDIISEGTFPLARILILAIEIAAVALIIGLGRFGWRFFIHGASRRIEKELRDKLFSHLLKLSRTFYSRYKTGDLMSRFTNDIDAIRMATGMALVALIDGIFMTLAILLILFKQDAGLTALTVLPLPLITVGILFFGKTIGEQFRRVQEGFSTISEMVQESISGIRVLKTFVQEKAYLRKFGEKNEEYSKRNMELVRIYGIFFPLIVFLSGLTNVIFLFLGGKGVIEGRSSPGDFTAFLSYLQMLVWPVMGAGFTITLIQRGTASLGRINRILEEMPDIASPEKAIGKPDGKKILGKITFKNLSFTYSDSHTPAVKNINLEIPEGTILGILGKTGSGKSTLVNLLPRILDPPPGTLFIDGEEVQSYDLSVLRSFIAMIPQDIFLFSDSICANISFGMKNRDGKQFSEKINRMAEISTINRDVRTFPEGLDTIIGERGVSLSGGQKQRIALSRALAVDPKILLLDDSFSSVDTETENSILQNLQAYLKGKTSILISHRISTLKIADFIIVMDGGEIVQRGTHETLVAEDGFYQEIYNIQKLGEVLEAKA